jgi:hypothetical protein
MVMVVVVVWLVSLKSREFAGFFLMKRNGGVVGLLM